MEDEIQEARRRRLAIARAMIRAHDQFATIEAAVSDCESKVEALDVLQRPPFGFSDVEAEHVLDLRLSTRTRAWRATIADEVRELEAGLAGALTTTPKPRAPTGHSAKTPRTRCERSAPNGILQHPKNALTSTFPRTGRLWTTAVTAMKAGGATRSPDTSLVQDSNVRRMKKLLLLVVLIALGALAAKKLQNA